MSNNQLFGGNWAKRSYAGDFCINQTHRSSSLEMFAAMKTLPEHEQIQQKYLVMKMTLISIESERESHKMLVEKIDSILTELIEKMAVLENITFEEAKNLLEGD